MTKKTKKQTNQEEEDEEEYVQEGCCKRKGIPWILSLSAVICLGFNLFLDITEGQLLDSFANIVIGAYIGFFGAILLFTCVLPIPLLIIDAFAFMDTRFGPGLYTIFISIFSLRF